MYIVLFVSYRRFQREQKQGLERFSPSSRYDVIPGASTLKNSTHLKLFGACVRTASGRLNIRLIRLWVNAFLLQVQHTVAGLVLDPSVHHQLSVRVACRSKNPLTSSTSSGVAKGLKPNITTWTMLILARKTDMS